MITTEMPVQSPLVTSRMDQLVKKRGVKGCAIRELVSVRSMDGIIDRTVIAAVATIADDRRTATVSLDDLLAFLDGIDRMDAGLVPFNSLSLR